MDDDGGAMNVTNMSAGPPGLPPRPVRLQIHEIHAYVLFSMAAVSFVANTLTLVTVCKLRQRQRSTVNTLIMQLAITDILVTLTCMVGDAGWKLTTQWLAGDAMCRIFKYLQMFSLYSTTNVLVVISLDRAMVVIHPMGRMNAPNRTKIMLIVAWALSVFFSIPQFLIFHVVRGPWPEDFYQCNTMGTYTAAWQQQTYTIFTLVVMFIVPLVVICVAYTLIFIKISRQTKDDHGGLQGAKDSRKYIKNTNGTAPPNGKHRRPPDTSVTLLDKHSHRKNGLSSRDTTVSLSDGAPQQQRRDFYRRARRSSLQMTVVIVLAFVLCWTPYYFLMLANIFQWESITRSGVENIIFFFGMSNSLLDPMIYGFFHLLKTRRRAAANRAGGTYRTNTSFATNTGGRSLRHATVHHTPSPRVHHHHHLHHHLDTPPTDTPHHDATNGVTNGSYVRLYPVGNGTSENGQCYGTAENSTQQKATSI